MRVCSQCKELKGDSCFGKWRYGKAGLRSYCKGCANSYMKGHYNKTPTGRYHQLKYNAKQAGIEFTIEKVDFLAWFSQQNMRCHYCKRDISFAQNKGNTHKLSSATIDRLNPNKGYSAANMVLACRQCNMVKGNWFTEEQMLEIAERYFIFE